MLTPAQAVITSIQSQRLQVELWVTHPGKNRKTTFTEEAIQNAAISSQNIPIVGFWNVTDFEGHEYRLVWQEDTIQQQYAGTIIGVVPETNNYRIEEKDDKMWVVVDGFIWTEYADYCLPALQGGKQISMEIDLLEVQEQEGETTISSFAYKGICVLGDHRTPAIESARLEIANNDLYEIKMKKGEELMSKTIENYEQVVVEPVVEVMVEVTAESVEVVVEPTENVEEPTENVEEPTENVEEPVEETEILETSISNRASTAVSTVKKEGDDLVYHTQTITVEEYISRYEELQKEHDALNTSYELLQAENTMLKNKALESIAQDFTDVTTYEEVSKMEGSIDEIELQLYALRGKKASAANYAVDTKITKPTNSSMPEWFSLIK